MEEQQKQQQQLIAMLVESQNKAKEQEAQRTKKRPLSDPEELEMDFESAFQLFINAYEKVPSTQRPNKLRKLFANSEKQITEMVGFWTESNGTCNCVTCPHKKELASFDSFFNDFLSPEL